MVTTKTRLMTAEDLLAMPDDDYRYELWEGELVRMPHPGEEHGVLAVELSFHLRSQLGNRGPWLIGSDMGLVLRLDPDTVVGPDVMVLRTDRLDPNRDRRRFTTAVPEVVVEIVSPSDRPGQVAKKVAKYRAFGVPLIWLLRPARPGADIHRADGSVRELGIDDTLDGEDILPGFRLALRELFGDD